MAAVSGSSADTDSDTDTDSLSRSDESATESPGTGESSDEMEQKNSEPNNNNEESDEFEFEASGTLATGSLAEKNMSSTRDDETKTSYVKNANYDEAMELEESNNSILSTATAAATAVRVDASKPGIVGSNLGKESKIENAQYDEALELSDTQSSLNTVDTSPGGGPDSGAASGRVGPGGKPTDRVYGQNYDEALELSSDTVNTVDTAIGEPAKGLGKPDKMAEISESSDMSDSSSAMSDSNEPPVEARGNGRVRNEKSNAAAPSGLLRLENVEAKDKQSKQKQRTNKRSTLSSDSSSTDSASGADSDSDEAKHGGKYANLNVSKQISVLFQYIKDFKPAHPDLDSKIKCFIPDFIPSIGEMDPFLKIHRPDGQNDELGLKVLDEPYSQQSERTVLELQLRAQTKRTGLKEVQVQSIGNAGKNPAAITAWIQNMQKLHLDKPLPNVSYAKPMPDIESLMQVFPAEFEEELKTIPLPEADIDLSTREYASVLCALLDVPVYKSMVQSLHVLFTLFAEFKANQHFQNLGGPDGPTAGGAPKGGAETLNLDSTVPEDADDDPGESSTNYFAASNF